MDEGTATSGLEVPFTEERGAWNAVRVLRQWSVVTTAVGLVRSVKGETFLEMSYFS